MTISLPLQPHEEAQLLAAAEARGLTPDALVQEIPRQVLGGVSKTKASTQSLRGLLAEYGPAPPAEEIDQNREEMFANFPRADF